MKKSSTVIRFVGEDKAEVTKAFMKNASIYGTEEYRLLKAFKAENPGVKICAKTIKKNPDKKTNRGRTYAGMLEYISTLENSKELTEQFEVIKTRSKIQRSPYNFVLTWFENNCLLEEEQAQAELENAAGF